MSRYPASRAAATARSVCSSDNSATPSPTTGMVFSSLRVMVGTVWLDDSVGVISPASEIEGAWVGVQSGAVVQRGDGRHVLFAELEVEHVEVARNPFRADRLGDDDVTQLQMPPNNHLGAGLAVR